MSDQAILDAAGISGDYPGDVIPKILNYGLLRNRVLDYLVETFAAQVLTSRFHASELEHLRVSVGAEVRKPKFSVRWALVPSDLGLSAGTTIVAKSFIGDSKTHDEIFYFKPRTIEEARAIRYRGQACPGDVLYLFSQYLDRPNSEWLTEVRQQERYKAEQAQKAQGTLKGDLAIAVAAQPPVGGK